MCITQSNAWLKERFLPGQRRPLSEMDCTTSKVAWPYTEMLIYLNLALLHMPQKGSEAKILTFWPKKSFYGNAHISGTRRPTGLAQVSKRPLDQGLRAWPFRLSVQLLVTKIAYVLSSPCISKFWLFDQNFKMAVFARFRFLKSKNPISGHN